MQERDQGYAVRHGFGEWKEICLTRKSIRKPRLRERDEMTDLMSDRVEIQRIGRLLVTHFRVTEFDETKARLRVLPPNKGTISSRG